MKKTLTFLAIALVATSSLGAQAAKKTETQAQLKAQAKISAADAEKTALALVPGGKVKEHELEKENGKLIWSFDIATKGKSGIDEVQIDAITGAQVGKVVHETAKDEKAEAAAEKKEAKAAKAKKP
ncbi:MAG: PepSY domain protein [Gemmatimonadetes bacterium]|nr:PepSY domain protein [Gemmatimonadota bacterium]